MTLLHPAMESIARAYAAWLGKRATESSDQEADQIDRIESEAGIAPESDGPIPDLIYDVVARMVGAMPELREPQSGDLVVLPPPADQDDAAEPQLPVAAVLDEGTGEHWSGWLVGAHTDYAGDRDLVLDASLIEGGKDPAPIAGMVLCWDRVSLNLPEKVEVIHHLTDAALEAIRALGGGSSVGGQRPEPGRMMQQEVAGQVVVTGTPYKHDDPRAEYLRLTRDLAHRLSEPEFDDTDRLPGPDRQDPER